ncbi:MAG TPA: VOC family protein [Verrucomicrobiae bacterium]|nr:VOC family protein [Verrucomicrobiae bacterium]
MNTKSIFALILGAALPLFAADAPQRPHITGLSHIALYVHDLEKSRAFYKDFLGYGEPYSLFNTNGSVHLTFIKINDLQYIELFTEKETNSDRLNHFSIQTDDVEGMRAYLAARGVKVPDKANKGRIGNVEFNVSDPDGHQVEIVQYMPDSWTVREKGKFMDDSRISTHLKHIGIIVTNLDASEKLYCGILGFQETWRGSRNTNQLSWVNLKVPDGTDYVELMLYAELPTPDKRGTAHHMSLEVADVDKAKAALELRPALANYSRPMQIQTGINRKRQMNLYDPDGTRVELMEPKTVDGIPAPSSSAPPPN